MLTRLRERAGSEKGFTLVELLVVMLILGILAAIAIPSFFNQRDKAKDADAKSLARTGETAVETYATDNQGVYTGVTVADLIAIEPTLQNADQDDPADGVQADEMTVTSGAPKEYTVTVFSTVANQSFSISRAADGTTSLTCTTDGKAGCPSGGTWD